MESLKWVKFCHYIFYGFAFISLFFSCYFLFMNEAIEKSKSGATTLIKRSENQPYESPTIIACTLSNFKPSVSRKYNLTTPARNIFNPSVDQLDINFIKDTFPNQTVQDLFEEFEYSNNDLMFFYNSTYLKLGKNEVNYGGKKLNVDLKKLPTFRNGACYSIESNQSNQKYAFIYIGYRFEMSHLNEFIKQVY